MEILAIDLERRNRISPILAVRDLEALSVIEDRLTAANALSLQGKISLLADALAALPDRCREIVVLHKPEDLSQKEVARRRQRRAVHWTGLARPALRRPSSAKWIGACGRGAGIAVVAGSPSQVAKNTSRPFVVSVAGVDVRAVGTSFSVQLGRTDADVLVTEGRVAVEKTAGKVALGDSPTAPAVPQFLADVSAGNRVVVPLGSLSRAVPPPPVLAVPAAELMDRLSWRVPRLEFSGTPLSDALAHFNRHGAG